MLSEVALAVAIPGWRLRHRARTLAAGLLFAGVVIPLLVAAYAVFSGRNWVALSLDGRYLAWVMIAGILALTSRVVAAGEVWLAVRDEHVPAGRDLWAVALVIGVVGSMLFGVVEVGRARASIQPAFAGGSGRPLFDASATSPVTVVTQPAVETTIALTTATTERAIEYVPPQSTTTTTTLPAKPVRPRSGVDPRLVADVTNVLLLGGDAGPGRSGLRTDTMMLFSLHRPSGRASLISIPRDLERLLFPPGSALEARYPFGFTDIANAVYPIVSANPDLRASYEVDDDVRPGVVAIAHGLGYSLDVTIDDYVLVDMQGFLDLIDALGGVTVNVSKAVPMPGNVPGARSQYPDTIGPGLIHMDGTTALGYVRSRKGDSDYQRTARRARPARFAGDADLVR